MTDMKPWGGWPFFDWPGRLTEDLVLYIVLVLYAVGFVLLLVRSRRDFAALRGSKLLFFLALLVLSLLLNNLAFFVVEAPDLLLPVSTVNPQAAEPASPGIPLFGLFPIIVGAAWVGVGPAMILGFVAGIFRAGATTHNFLEPFVLTFQVALISYLLRQDYRGRLEGWARQPFVALVVVALLIQPVNLFSAFAFAFRPNHMLTSMDYAWTFLSITFRLFMVEAAYCGFFFQVLYWLAAHIRPVRVAQRSPSYARSLNRRLQFIFLFIFVLVVILLVYAVVATAIESATDQAVDALLRDADNGTNGVVQFVNIGRNLIRQFAGNPELWSGDQTACQGQLRDAHAMLPYFNHLNVYDVEIVVHEDGNHTVEYEPLCAFPDLTERDMQPTPDEQSILGVVLQTGGLQTTHAHRGPDGQVVLSFLSSLEDNPHEPTGENRYGVLVGRTEMRSNPLLEQVLSSLQATVRSGEGFVVDTDRGYIVVHPDKKRLLERWEIDQSRPALAVLGNDRGWVRESRDPDTNARQLACYVEVEGYPWAVVILLPYEVVLELATSIAEPLVFLLAVLAVVVVVAIPLATNQLTRPLNLLSRAAERIAEGNLSRAVHVAGDDEVARVGEAFEKMRVRLKDRLEDLSLLLQVAQDVSSTLDIAQGLPRILEGALKSTSALIARVVLLSASGEPQVVVGRGETMAGVAKLDRALSLAARDVDHPLLIENLRRARTLSRSGPLPEEVQAVVALPVRSKKRTVAVLWVGFEKARRFEASEVDLLSTLASQTAVLTENARLFQMAEGGRRRLAAILSSTGDGILVTGRDGRLLLVNPAAERALNLRGDELVNQVVSQVPMEPGLTRVLTEPLGRAGPLVEEVPLPDGRTFYASASTIFSADGEKMGRVVVMRDITHFKELDEMKSEFVATVSHDLRAPLTFMRGYAAMLPMVGEVNQKQQEYVEKIMVGIEKMGDLIQDLLNLGRIEAGIGLEKNPCHAGALIVEAVEGMRARATAKGVTLRMEASERAPIIMGDATLLRQAIANLVDNAIKYTPTNGLVTVKLQATKEEILILVADTGMGIAPENQVRLFERFYRIHRQDLTEDIPGSGLGLALVKSIVGWHDGRVWVDSELDKGSTFTIALPVGDEKEADA